MGKHITALSDLILISNDFDKLQRLIESVKDPNSSDVSYELRRTSLSLKS